MIMKCSIVDSDQGTEEEQNSLKCKYSIEKKNRVLWERIHLVGI